MVFRYSAWDGTQSINPLDPDALLELLATDLLEEGDLASALQRFLMRGAGKGEARVGSNAERRFAQAEMGPIHGQLSSRMG